MPVLKTYDGAAWVPVGTASAGSYATATATVTGAPASADVPLSPAALAGTTPAVYVAGFRWPGSLVTLSVDRATLTVGTDADWSLSDGDLITVDYRGVS